MTGKPRQGGARNQRGGPNKLPRSLGKVFKAIRVGLNINQTKMREVLEATPSPFILRAQKGSGNPGASVSTWEYGQENNAFAVQHRYATIAGCYTGILHIVSLLYANWRDAEVATDNASRDRSFDDNYRIAAGLRALAIHVETENKRLAKDGGGEPKKANVEDDTADLHQIAGLLDAYCSGARTLRQKAIS